MKSTKLDAMQVLGECFMTGFDGPILSDDTSAFLSQASIGGVLLFSHNYQDPRQLAELTNQVQDCRRDLPLWIAADQEGGRVQRFKNGFTLLPPAAELGILDSPKAAFEVSDICARELKLAGINVNFAPCADILTEPKNKVIGDRSFGQSEELVSKMVSAFVRGHIKAGVQPCIKHFPGHGSTVEDSHDELPKIHRSLQQLKDCELKPFIKAFKSRCSMVMSAHILNDLLDPTSPATFSPKTLKTLLRKDLRYQRIVFSDDMEMSAVTKTFGVEEAPVKALLAGCDVLIYRSEKATRKAYDSVRKALDLGAISPSVILEAADRSLTLKEEFLKDFEQVSPDLAEKKIGTQENQELLKKALAEP